jgi:PadR family transcriptional regulator, regulatory protein PadR
MKLSTNCACMGKSLPKLLRPALLSVLAKGGAHGYAILDALKQLDVFAVHPPDHTGVYRALQAMEKEGLVASDWEHPDKGLPRRNYRMTPKGGACLDKWTQTLEGYRRTLDALLAFTRGDLGNAT